MCKYSLAISLGQKSLCQGTDYNNVTIIAVARWTPKNYCLERMLPKTIFSRPPSVAPFTHMKLTKTHWFVCYQACTYIFLSCKKSSI